MKTNIKFKIPASSSIRIVNIDTHEWTFELPRISIDVYEDFDCAIDLYNSGQINEAEKIYKNLIKQYPEFIDCYHHYALLLKDSGAPFQAFEIWLDISKFCIDLLPNNFYFGRDILPWLSIDNRPFLRAYHSLGLEYANVGETDKALNIFNNIIEINPNDNQGIRALLVKCYFQLKRPHNVLQLSEKFTDDGMAEIVYGAVLAHYQLDQLSIAKKKLLEASKFLPLVSKEITKKQHRRPKNVSPFGYTVGGEDQAYYYWTEFGDFWKNTAGAIEYVQNTIK